MVVFLPQHGDFQQPMEFGHLMIVVRAKEDEEAVKETSIRQNRLRSTNERIKKLTGGAGLRIVAAGFFFTAVFFFYNYKVHE